MAVRALMVLRRVVVRITRLAGSYGVILALLSVWRDGIAIVTVVMNMAAMFMLLSTRIAAEVPKRV